MTGNAIEILHAARPKQWVKNALIAAPLLLAGGIPALMRLDMFIAVVGFIAVNAAVYLLNDVVDADEDRTHPRKRHRPVAAGRVRPAVAWNTAAALGISGMAVGWYTGTVAWFVLYVAVNVLYTLRLKRVPFLEMFVVASGFPVRVAIGLTLLEDVVSWGGSLLAVSFCGAVVILTGKRYGEIAEHGRGSRRVLRWYTTRSLAVIGVAGTLGAFAAITVWAAAYGAIGVTVLAPFAIGAARVAALAARGELAEPERLAVDAVTVTAAFVTVIAAVWLLMRY